MQIEEGLTQESNLNLQRRWDVTRDIDTCGIIIRMELNVHKSTLFFHDLEEEIEFKPS